MHLNCCWSLRVKSDNVCVFYMFFFGRKRHPFVSIPKSINLNRDVPFLCVFSGARASVWAAQDEE